MSDSFYASSLHVALVTPWQVKGGIATYSDRLVTALEEQGVQVTPVGIAKPHTPNPRRFNEIITKIPDDADIVHVQFEAGVFGRLAVSGVCAPSFFHRLGNLALPSVTTLHEVHSSHAQHSLPADLLLRLRDFLIERCILSASDALIVHTTAAQKTLQARHGETDRLRKFYHPAERDANPLDTRESKQKLGLSTTDTVYLTFGWVEAKKNYADVISTLPDDPTSKYIIAGEPRTAEGTHVLDQALRRAAELGVRERVVHLGYVEPENVSTVFSAADAVILPYERVSQSGVVNLALAYHCPVVATALPAFVELHDEFECLATYQTQDELSSVLTRLRTDKTYRRRLIRNARQYANTVTWDHLAGETVNLYRQALRVDPESCQ